MLMFDSLLVSCHEESVSHAVSAVCHKTPVVRNHINKSWRAKTLAQVFQGVSGCNEVLL